MKLTYKCKSAFNKWFINHINSKLIENRKDWGTDDELLNSFYNNLIDSMQYGVYVDFFDSVGISVNTCDWKENNEIIYLISVDKLGLPNHFRLLPRFNTRQEARQKAIEKANEIYNKL